MSEYERNRVVVVMAKNSQMSSDRPKPKFEPKPKLPKFRFIWAETEIES
jgi:hypothetical protein